VISDIIYGQFIFLNPMTETARTDGVNLSTDKNRIICGDIHAD